MGQPSTVEFRIVLDHLCKNFLNPRCTFISAYNVHYNTYILGHSFSLFSFDLWRGEGVIKALAASPQPEDCESGSCYAAQEE